MAIKKSIDMSEDIEPTRVEPEPKIEVPIVSEAKAVSAKSARMDDAEFCVYLGPTIRGVIQSGAVYKGNRKVTETALAAAIAKYPMIARLIVTNKTLAEDRIKIKTAGNALNVFYKKLASGKSI